jgi:gamma-butyrobetaine dioxygenase
MLAVHSLRNLHWSPEVVVIDWQDGVRCEYPSLWLRDNCPADRNPQNGQRLIDITDVPSNPRIGAVNRSDGRLEITWIGESRPVSFELEWLAKNPPSAQRTLRPIPDLWLDGAKLDARRDFAWGVPAALRTDASARRTWLRRLVTEGMAFLEQVPSTNHAMLDALDFVGRVIETNYGLVFDVRSVPQPENLAYSDLGLGLHTDNPYREPVPGFQALHCLVAAPDGGENLFADGFAIAEHLRATRPDLFKVLTSTLVPFHYRSKNAELYAERPLVELDAGGRVVAINYNNRSIAPLNLDAKDIVTFYGAYRAFALELQEPRYALRIKLQDGMLVVFDNRRTLHGRTSYASAKHVRHLQGCYLTRDSVLSELAVLERTLAAAPPQ